jgi:hypothetical protein
MLTGQPWYTRPWANYQPGRHASAGAWLRIASGTVFLALAVDADDPAPRILSAIGGVVFLSTGLTFVAALRRARLLPPSAQSDTTPPG